MTVNAPVKTQVKTKVIKKVIKPNPRFILFKRVRAVLVLLGISVVTARGCSILEESQTLIVLRNQSEKTVNFMEVKLNNKTFEIRNVLPGQQHVWKFKRAGESSFTVNGRLAAANPIRISSLGNLAGDRNREHHLTIDESGQVSYSSPK